MSEVQQYHLLAGAAETAFMIQLVSHRSTLLDLLVYKVVLIRIEIINPGNLLDNLPVISIGTTVLMVYYLLNQRILTECIQMSDQGLEFTSNKTLVQSRFIYNFKIKNAFTLKSVGILTGQDYTTPPVIAIGQPNISFKSTLVGGSRKIEIITNDGGLMII